MNETIKKFIPVMLTAFKEDGEVDLYGLAELTEFYLAGGAEGLFANCLSSEMFELNENEKLAVIKQVVKTTNGAVPVVATGTFNGSIATQAECIKKVFDTGVKGVVVNTNMIAEEGAPDEIFNDRMLELFALTGNIPLGLYECPREFKRLVSPEQLQMFVNTGRLIYHKDTCCDIEGVKAKLAVVQNHPEFEFYDAYMAHAVESLHAGSAGLSSIQGNFWPELITWLCRNYNKPGIAMQVEMVQQFLTGHMEIVHTVYPLSAKYYLQQRGLSIIPSTRQKANVLPPEIIKKLVNLDQEFNTLSEKIGLPSVNI